MGKKKATGMSKRLGFTDRATIAENKDILRYNERLEREAKGLPAEPERRSGGPRRAPSNEKRPRPDRPARAPRPPRPPALDDEQKAVLQAALDSAVGETGLEEAGKAVIARLAEHDSFDKASNAGWEQAAGGHAAERTAAEWDLLRQVWLGIRLALLEAYVAFKPELEPTLSRERKQVARIARSSGPQRKRRPARQAATAGEGKAAAGRTPRKPKPAGPPSPADIVRRIGKAGVPGDVVLAAPTGPVAETALSDSMAGSQPESGAESSLPGATSESATSESPNAAEAETPSSVEAVEAGTDEVADTVERAMATELTETTEPEPGPAEQEAAEQELRAEHGTGADAAGDESVVVDADQLKLEI